MDERKWRVRYNKTITAVVHFVLQKKMAMYTYTEILCTR